MNKDFLLLHAPEDADYAAHLLNKVRRFSVPRKYRGQCPHYVMRLACSMACSVTADGATHEVQHSKYLGVLCTPAMKGQYEQQANELIELFSRNTEGNRNRIIPIIHLESPGLTSSRMKVGNGMVEQYMPEKLLADESSRRQMILGTCVQVKGEKRVVCDVASMILGINIDHMPLEPRIKASLVVAGGILLTFACAGTYLKLNNAALVPGFQLLARGVLPSSYEKHLRLAAEKKDDKMVSLLLSAYSENPESLKRLAFNECHENELLGSVLKQHYAAKLKDRLLELPAGWQNDEKLCSEVEGQLPVKVAETWERVIKDNDLELAEEILLAGDYVNMQLPQYGSPLHCAAALGQSDMVSLLLENGAQLEVLDSSFRLPVDYASCAKTLAALQYYSLRKLEALLNTPVTEENYRNLLKKIPPESFNQCIACVVTAGFDLDYHSEECENPLVLSSATGRLNRVAYITTRNLSAEVLNAALAAASFGGQARVVSFLLEHGANVNFVEDGNPVLMLAIYSGSEDCVKALLDKNPDLGCRAAHTLFDPISFAVSVGRHNVIKLLYDKGADINVVNPISDRTPLAVAVGSITPIEGVTALMECGADINEQTEKWKETPLMIAIERIDDAEEVVRHLLRYKPDLERKNQFGNTALGLAVERNKPGIVKILLDAHASLKATGDDSNILALALTADMSSYQVSKQQGLERNFEVVKLLIEAGADVNAQQYGFSVLETAIMGKRPDIALLLLEKGAELAKCRAAGKIALARAMLNDYKEVLALMKKQNPSQETMDAAMEELRYLQNAQRPQSLSQ